ncbi:response regulator transcription factor [Mumia zhuanghuii]|uniref:LytR/AlgR family response regulator transcription factor n=2 Tax=Mumia TaxID=1546255 RepID=A0ABW1QQG7_9ACTN|nr:MULTISPECIES: LytTR family DNA-binding domain-containing protein [Mumia]KAA1425246.1 response regulator transcription factor [Mumia zhuanghuii]
MGLNVLVADDEQPVLDELVYLLDRDERIDHVTAVTSGADVLRALEADEAAVDAVFLDIAMPALSGLEVARVLARFRNQPKVVFVTAHEDHAVDAWDLDAVDYVLKPVAEDRLRESVRRVLGARPADPRDVDADEVVAVELAGVTRFVPRSSVAYVEAQGDYVRLHTVSGDSHLLRTPLVTLEHDWADAGFVRIHRSLLVDSARVREVRMLGGRCTILVDVGGSSYVELQVARRHTRDLRTLVQQRARTVGS